MARTPEVPCPHSCLYHPSAQINRRCPFPDEAVNAISSENAREECARLMQRRMDVDLPINRALARIKINGGTRKIGYEDPDDLSNS